MRIRQPAEKLNTVELFGGHSFLFCSVSKGGIALTTVPAVAKLRNFRRSTNMQASNGSLFLTPKVHSLEVASA